MAYLSPWCFVMPKIHNHVLIRIRQVSTVHLWQPRLHPSHLIIYHDLLSITYSCQICHSFWTNSTDVLSLKFEKLPIFETQDSCDFTCVILTLFCTFVIMIARPIHVSFLLFTDVKTPSFAILNHQQAHIMIFWVPRFSSSALVRGSSPLRYKNPSDIHFWQMAIKKRVKQYNST